GQATAPRRRKAKRRGKSEHDRTRWWLTTTGPVAAPGQCHRKHTASGARPQGRGQRARVKRCGKSAPLGRRRPGLGKPHRVQAQAVLSWFLQWGRRPRSAARGRVACWRRSATVAREKWSSPAALEGGSAQNSAYVHEQPGRPREGSPCAPLLSLASGALSPIPRGESEIPSQSVPLVGGNPDVSHASSLPF